MDALRINEAFGINFHARGNALNAATWDTFSFELSSTRAATFYSNYCIQRSDHIREHFYFIRTNENEIIVIQIKNRS